MTAPGEQPAWLRCVVAVRDEFAVTAAALSTTEVTRSVGGVTVTLAGNGELRSVRIDTKASKAAATMEKNIMLAYQEARQAVEKMVGGMTEPLRGIVAQANSELGLDG